MISCVVTLVAAIGLSAVNAAILPPQHGHRVVCYLGTEDAENVWFTAAEAEPALHMCTHVIYPCAILRNLNIVVLGRNTTDGYSAFINIKNLISMKINKFPNLKIILGVGMMDFTSIPYAWMAETPERRSVFIQNVAKILVGYKLDGMEVGWKFQFVDSNFTIKNFHQVVLLKELRQEFDKHGLIVSMAVLTGVDGGGDVGVDTPGLAKHAHFLNIGSQVHSHFSGPVDRHMSYGVPPDKINIVVYSMGVSYKFENNFPINNRTDITRKVTPYRLKAFSELCKEMEGGGWSKEVENDTGVVAYGNKDFLIITDNSVSTDLKVSYVMEKALGGVAFRSLAGDDHKGECVGSGGKYPMLRDIDRRLVDLAPDAYKDIFDHLKQHDANYFWNGMKSSTPDEEAL